MPHWRLSAARYAPTLLTREETRNLMRFPMTAHLNHADSRFRVVIAAIGEAARRFGAAVAANSEAMRCSREAERLFGLSDAELAKLGLTRDRIVHHAFRRYLGT
jgi:hypothetical protein